MRVPVTSPQAHRQQGAALIVSMLVLTVLTLLSLSAMNSAALHQRVSGHLKEGQLAFESADAALRDAETWLDTLPTQTPPCSSVATDCELFEPQALYALEGAEGQPWWSQTDAAWWQQHGLDFIADGQDLAQHHDDPYSVVEELERVPDSLVVGLAPGNSWVYYRITARGVGGTERSQSVVQSTFVKPSN